MISHGLFSRPRLNFTKLIECCVDDGENQGAEEVTVMGRRRRRIVTSVLEKNRLAQAALPFQRIIQVRREESSYGGIQK